MKLENSLFGTKYVTKKNGNREQNVKYQLKKLERKLDEDNLTKYNITSQKVYKVGANSTHMNTPKN